MIKLKITLLSTLFACMAMVFVTSCEQENVNVNDALEQESEEIFNFLLESGFEMDEVTITHDFVQVNNDYGWFRSDFLSMMRGENDLEHVCYSDDEIACDTEMPLEFRQTYFNFTRIGGAAAISRQNLSDIRFFIHPSVARDCGQVWVNAALNAINAWNGISGLRVRFRRVSSLNNADLVFASDEQNVGQPGRHLNLERFETNNSFPIAVSGMPNNKIFRFITINSANDLGPVSGSRRGIMMHEIGHCLGFANIDDRGLAVQQIHNLPRQDPKSIMNSVGPLPNNFSPGDIIAARMFYANNYAKPANFVASRRSAGTVQLRYRNPQDINNPYFFIRAIKYDQNGNFLAFRGVRALTNNSGVHTFTWAGHGSGRFGFAVRGTNFRQDILSPRTPIRFVNL